MGAVAAVEAVETAKREKKTPACPKWLDPEAKREWRRLARRIRLSEEHTAIFAGYCQAYARWREAEEYIAEHGTTDGNNRTLPQVAVAQTYLGIMSEFAGQLGLTPAGGASGG